MACVYEPVELHLSMVQVSRRRRCFVTRSVLAKLNDQNGLDLEFPVRSYCLLL